MIRKCIAFAWIVFGMMLISGCHSSRSIKQEPSDLPIPKGLQESINLIKYSIPYESVEVKPTYKRKEAAQFVQQYFLENLRNPEPSLFDNLKGEIRFSIVIDQNGKAKLVDLKGANPYLNSEIERIISSLPRFRCGWHNGVPVPVLMRSTYTFR